MARDSSTEQGEMPFAQQGGHARAQKLSSAERKRIASEAARARWSQGENILRATHGSTDKPLTIGSIELSCYVLEDGTRVVTMSGMLKALSMSLGGAGKGTNNRLYKFIDTKGMRGVISEELRNKIANPILFNGPNRSLTYGYEATILPDICDAVLQARPNLHPLQRHIANQCEILVRGLARTGIISLVDEATGYQEVRSRRALEDILNKYLSEELRKYTKTFPDEYFSEVFRLKDWNRPASKSARPGAFYRITNNVVYERLAPGVLEELQKRNPTDGHGKRRHKHFQLLTDDFGDPRLRVHLDKVVFLMSACSSWGEFVRLLDRAAPKVNAIPELPFSEADSRA